MSENSDFWNFTVVNAASLIVAILAFVASLIMLEMQRRTKELNLIVTLHKELDIAQWNLLEAKKEKKQLRLNSLLNTLEMICAILNARYTKQQVIEQSVLNNLAVLKNSFESAWKDIDQKHSEPSAFEEIRKFSQKRQNRLDSAVTRLGSQ